MDTQQSPAAASFQSEHPSALDHKLGTVLTQVSAQTVCGFAPVQTNTQPAGMWHGGASAALMETLASVGATLHAGPQQIAVGTELSLSHLRAVRAGNVYGTATAVHLGRSTATYVIELRDDEGQLVASGRLSCRILAQPQP